MLEEIQGDVDSVHAGERVADLESLEEKKELARR